MAGRVVPMRVGNVELLVETVPVAGSEQTSGRAGKATQRVVDGFEQAEGAIEAIAVRLAGTLERLAGRSVHPDRVEVQFGLKFTAEGNVLVAGSSVEASLQVTVGYDRAAALPASSPQAP
jgi:hypothetical protein